MVSRGVAIINDDILIKLRMLVIHVLINVKRKFQYLTYKRMLDMSHVNVTMDLTGGHRPFYEVFQIALACI